MFDNKGFMTTGFRNKIPEQTKMVLISQINALQSADYQVDYLQIISLSLDIVDGEMVQKVIHSQEQPAHNEVFYFSAPECEIISEKVYVIDDKDHHTYLLASEY